MIFAIAFAYEAIAQVDDAPSVESATAVRTTTYRLQIHVWERPNEGLLVARVMAGGPADNMRLVGDDSVAGSLEPHDLITAIDGNPIRSLQDYYQAMHASRHNGGKIVLSVRDVNTEQVRDWRVQAAEVQTSMDIPPVDTTGQRRIHFVLCGLTNDNRIGEAVRISLFDLEETLRSQILEQYIGEFTIVTGNGCQADKIREAVTTLPVQPNDTVFVYYAGHGAYDATRADDDPSHGHHFQIPSGDLMRKDLFHAMTEKNPRLAVLVSDTCNVESYAQPKLRPVFEMRVKTIVGNTPTEKLLLLHRGVVDLSASSTDQYSWFSTPLGGWFTSVFCPALGGHEKWNPLLDHLRSQTDETYRGLREMILANPADIPDTTILLLRGQEHMVPQSFQFTVREDHAGFTPPEDQRQIPVKVARYVPGL